MAIKYMAGERLIGTAAERVALGGADHTSNGGLGGGTFGDWSDTGTMVTATNTPKYYPSVVTFDVTERSNSHTVTQDLGSTLSNTEWVMRFKLNFITIGAANSAFVHINYGLSEDPASTPAGGTGGSNEQDAIYFKQMLALDNSSENIWGLTAYDSTGGGVDPSPTMDLSPVIGKNYHVELKRTAVDTITVGLYTDSNYDTLISGIALETKTIPSTITNLRYIRIGNDVISSGSVVVTIEGTASEFEVWDDVTTATYPNLPNGTLFEESDTGKHYMFDTKTWNEIT